MSHPGHRQRTGRCYNDWCWMQLKQSLKTRRAVFDELSAKLFDFLLPCSTESQIFNISGDELIISKTYIHTTSSKPHHLQNIHTYLNDELISGRPLNTGSSRLYRFSLIFALQTFLKFFRVASLFSSLLREGTDLNFM